MNIDTQLLLQEIEQLKARVSTLESERGAVRSDTIVSPPTGDDDTPQDRPISPDVGALEPTPCSDTDWRDTVAAWSEEKHKSDMRGIVQEVDEFLGVSAAASIAAFIDRFNARTTVANEPSAKTYDGYSIDEAGPDGQIIF